MLKNYKTIVSANNPDVILHSFVIGKHQHFAIDTWAPNLHNNMDDDDKMSAYESALGYRLRTFSNPEDALFVPPIPLPYNDLFDILRDNLEMIKNNPIFIGFQYDGHAPGEASFKNSGRVIRFLQEMGANYPILSTAYRPNGHFWGITLRGQMGLEFRITGLCGVNTISKGDIGNIVRRMGYYGAGSPWMIRIGPITNEEVNPLSLTSLYGNRGIGERGSFGHRIFIPEEPIIPSGYINLLERNKKSSIISPSEFRSGKFPQDKMFNALLRDIGGGYLFEIYGSNKLDKYSHPVFRDEKNHWMMMIDPIDRERRNAEILEPMQP